MDEPAISRRPTPPTPSSAFAGLGISAGVAAALAKNGIRDPFPIQAQTIPDALAGRDICGKARTGSGKTLAFGLPMIERTARCQPRHPQSLVLVPTRELASQVTTALAPLAAIRGVRIASVYGGVSLFRQAQAMRAGVDIVIATPGRLFDLLQRGDVSVAAVRMVVLDEADQMADLGFLPQVERILCQIEQQHQTLLFSATLDGDVKQLVKRYQHEPVYHDVASEEEAASDMKHRFIAVSEQDKVAVAADIAAGPGRTLLFVRTQRGAERLARQLDIRGVAAGMLHGGMSQPKRERALRCFTMGTVPVLVATNIAARGIHVDGVDIVVHHDPPEDTKTYLHRSGRTARAGASGLVVTLVAPEQLRAVNLLRREAGVSESVVAIGPGDRRLADLAAWSPPLEDHALTAPAPALGFNRFPPNGRNRRGGTAGYAARRRLDQPPPRWNGEPAGPGRDGRSDRPRGAAPVAHASGRPSAASVERRSWRREP